MHDYPFPLAELVPPTLAIVAIGFALAFWFTRRAGLSLGVAAVKGGLFLAYFGFIFDGTYTFYDDWAYLQYGKQLLQDGVSIFNLFHHYDYVRSTVKSANLFYYVYNASAMTVFGHGYFAPVAMNVLLTFIAAGMLMRAAQLGLGMSRRTSIGLFACLALAPSILAWSTIANLKDILVATGTAGLVLAIALIEVHRFKRAIVTAALWGLVLIVTRFYVPLIAGAAFGATLLLSRQGRRNPWLWVGAAGALVVVAYGLGHGSVAGALRELHARGGNPAKGIVRFIATPIPFHTQPEYAFLNLPQLVFWALLPLQFYGMFALWRRSTLTGRFMVLYCVALMVLYGAFPTLQGPRHRVQIDGLIVVFQYVGIAALLRQRFRLPVRRAPRARPAGRRDGALPAGAGGV
ncbi:MAG TPA: hypothetical protein VFQ95_06725 [Rhodanobacteraceae bacterium]|nr:hypothetical protein [Rhodanobacteraceae bacterium]